MSSCCVLVMAKGSDRLRAVLDTSVVAREVRFLDDLTQTTKMLERHQPEVLLLYRDTGFDGPQFREAVNFPSVRWAHVSGSGYEFLNPMTRTDLIITNGQGLRSRNLAETALGALIALNNGLLKYHDQQQSQIWQVHEFRPLEDQSLLIVGAGTIGQVFAAHAKALGMTVTGVCRSGKQRDPFDQMIALEELKYHLPTADVISLHLRLTPETAGLFDADKFDRMKETALFLNTARGGIVREPDLCEALATKRIRGAYLDVFAVEPLPSDSALWHMENILISPHAADCIVDWDIKGAQFFAKNLACWTNAEPMLNVVQLEPKD